MNALLRRLLLTLPFLAGLGCALEESDFPPSDTAADDLDQAAADSGTEGLASYPALSVYPGYEDPHYQLHDVIFNVLADDFNRWLAYEPGDAGWLDPDLLKSWAIQESGGTSPSSWNIWEQGDILQVNNAGDWSDDKRVKVGLRRDQVLTPGMSMMFAIRWAYHKGCSYQQGEPTAASGWAAFSHWEWAAGGLQRTRVHGYRRRFSTWRRALFNYNGNRKPWVNYRSDALIVERDGTLYETREHYVRTVFERYEGVMAAGE